MVFSTQKSKFLHKKYNKIKAWFSTQSNIFYFEKKSSHYQLRKLIVTQNTYK